MLPLRPFVTRSLVFLALAGAADTAAAQVDLFAQTINGAPQITPGKEAWVQMYVLNVGDPYAGTFDIDVLLGDDLVVDPSDIVVASFTSASVGIQQFFFDIPANFPEGLYQWGVRIHPVAGEANLSNNDVVGNFVAAYSVDLDVLTPSPIAVFRESSDEPVPVRIDISNVGTSNGVLLFKAYALEPAPWLEINPPGSFAIGGQPANEITLTVDPEGLPEGDVSVTVRFENIHDAADFEDVLIELTVTPEQFVPGDRLRGFIQTVDEVNEFAFWGLEGMKLVTSTTTPNPASLAPRLTLLDDDGNVIRSVVLKHAPRTPAKSTFKLPACGVYTLRVEGEADTKGPFEIATAARLPAAAKKRNVVLKNPQDASIPEIDVMLFEGGVLDATFLPNPRFGGPLVPGVVTPNGLELSLGANADSFGVAGVKIVDLPAVANGAYRVQVLGFGADPKAKVKIALQPIQPPKGTGLIQIP